MFYFIFRSMWPYNVHFNIDILINYIEHCSVHRHHIVALTIINSLKNWLFVFFLIYCSTGIYYLSSYITFSWPVGLRSEVHVVLVDIWQWWIRGRLCILCVFDPFYYFCWILLKKKMKFKKKGRANLTIEVKICTPLFSSHINLSQTSPQSHQSTNSQHTT